MNHSGGAYDAADAASGLRAHVHATQRMRSGLERAIVGAWRPISRKHIRHCLRAVALRANNRTGHQSHTLVMFSGTNDLLPRTAPLA